MVDTIDTDDEFDVDRLVDDLRQKTNPTSKPATAATTPAVTASSSSSSPTAGSPTTAREVSRHRRHHSVMGSASIAGDVRAGWSAAASAALERARLRAAGATLTDQKSTIKSPLLQRNGSRSASGSFEEYRASRSATPASTPPSRQSNTPLQQQQRQQQQKDQLVRSLQRRANSDDSVPTLSSGASNNEPSPSATTAVESLPSSTDSLSRPSVDSSSASLTEESKATTAGIATSAMRSSLIINGQDISSGNPDRLINVGQQNTYQSLIGAIKEQQTPPLQPAKLVSSDVLSDTVSERSNDTIRAIGLLGLELAVEAQLTRNKWQRPRNNNIDVVPPYWTRNTFPRMTFERQVPREEEEEEETNTGGSETIRQPLKNKIISNLLPGSSSASSAASSSSSLVASATHAITACPMLA
ncbi:hypothetical protein BDF22DRAFT_324277 [Syncephalis plumigaleata]|nr:hypothetical protein BDF22DRAFT_324277 [Syncephalis plumigaleata]